MSVPIFSQTLPVGTIEPGPEGLRLRYEDSWRSSAEGFAISLSTPLDAAEGAAEIFTPWLMNLLPEGEPLRAMTRALGMAREDILGLIGRAGQDMAGALSFGEPFAADAADYRVVGAGDALERVIEELPARPFLIGEDGVSMSLAGAQEKLPVALVEGAIAIPLNGAASTHILKPDNPRLPGSVENEALCMALARRCGLSAARVTTGLAGARRYLLVERYDRIAEADGVRRLHQEDFCQALGRPPAAKYERNGTGARGVSLADMFALLRGHMTARDITRLLDAAIFNIAIGNVDSHAKNYSILLRPRNSVLAPLYDLMSGLTWSNITQNHAQEIGGQPRGRYIQGRHWRRMAAQCGLAQPATVRRVIQVIDRLLAELPAAAADVAAMPAGATGALATLVEAIAARARLVRDNATRDGADPPDGMAEPETGATRYGGE